MKKNIIFLSMMIIGFIMLLEIPVGSIFATSKVTICHKNNGNGWSKISVDQDAVNGQGNGDHNSSGHQNGQDIIPAGFWDWNGRNWDATGQAIWNNDCNVPAPTPTPTLEPSITPTATPSATLTPSPTVTPDPCAPTEDGWQLVAEWSLDGKLLIDCEEKVTPTPTMTPTLTPTPRVEILVEQASRGESSVVTPTCLDAAPHKAPDNFHVYRNGDQALVRWYYDATIPWKVIVYYGISGLGDQHAVIFDNKPGAGLIEGLGTLDIDFRATFLNGCAAGKSTHVVIDGVTNNWRLFR